MVNPYLHNKLCSLCITWFIVNILLKNFIAMFMRLNRYFPLFYCHFWQCFIEYPVFIKWILKCTLICSHLEIYGKCWIYFYMNVYINVKTQWWCQLNIGFQILPVSIFEKFYFLEIFSKFQLLTVIQNNILTSSGYVRFFSFIYFLNQMWRSILIILSISFWFVINFHYIRNIFFY